MKVSSYWVLIILCTVILCTVILCTVILCPVSFSFAEPNDRDNDIVTITETGLANTSWPKPLWESSAREAATIALQASLVKSISNSHDVKSGKATENVSGTIVGWKELQKYLTISYHPSNKMATATINVPKRILLKSILKN